MKKKIYKNELLHHNFAFTKGVKQNIKILGCRLVGHKYNALHKHTWCGRCGLADTEIYHKQQFESDYVEDQFFDIKGEPRKTISIDGHSHIINDDVFEFVKLILEDNDDLVDEVNDLQEQLEGNNDFISRINLN